MHTSLHSRVEPDIEETPGKTVISKIDKPPWKLDNSAKRVRRPLVETMMPPEPSRLYNENLGHFSQKDNITGVDNFVKQKVLDTPIIPISKTTSALVESSNDVNYDLKENLGPMSFQLPPKVPDQLQPPRELDKKQTNCLPPTSSSVAVPATPEPLQSLPTISTANSNNNKNLVKQPDNKLFQPMSISAAPPCQYGKKMSVKGKEYIILGTLGQGMSGEVYRVQDTSNLELKAIKYVNLARMDHESAQSCLNEIKMLNKLQAPSVVTMYDHEVSNRSIYVVMEMGDTDLSRFLKSVSAEKRTLPLTMILYYWTEMLTAVKHIHDNGVIHSDLKPANFLLVRGRLKLIDFGISSSLNAEMTSIVKSTTVGTLNYISPEALMDVGGTGDSPHQNTKYKISYKSDVWSLGCILYSLVYGITPFHNIRQQWAKINAITNPHPRISYSLPPHVEAVPVILIDVIKKCLQHDPKARPSVDQLLQVQYISMARNVPISSPDIPANILIKIKQSLQDSEWRIFTEVLGQRRPH
ncbi:dual specificity protein kinase TTK [Fopius arisanus]|nr:PREDICTED: dual specificity protein kinase TTK [Fopius arisanus]